MVVGVAPRGFQGTTLRQRVDVFVPVLTATTVAARKENFFSDHAVDNGDGMNSPIRWLRVVGRLRAGVSREQAEAEARVVASSTASSVKGATLSLVPAVQSSLYERDRLGNTRLAWLLEGIVGLVLLVGCTGLGGLLLAQTEKRRREFAARLALGASRSRLFRQHLTETALLVSIGYAVGLAVSRMILGVLAQFPLPGLLAIQDADPRLNGHVLAFTMMTAFVTAMLCGVVPAWRGSFAHDVASSLKTVGRTTAHGRSRLQPAMLAVQIALTLVLLVGASLFVRSVQAGFAVDLGFRPGGLITAEVNPRLRRYDLQRATALVDELSQRLERLPAVRSVAVGATPLSIFPLSGPTLEADGQRKPVRPYVGISFIDRDYFHTMGIRIVRGRSFSRDDTTGSAPVAVVNEALARALWPDQDAVGRQITRLPVGGPSVVPRAGVIGVVANASVSLADRGTPILYLLRAQNPIFNADATTITVRLDRDPEAFASMFRQQIRAVDRDLPVISIRTMNEQVEKVLATQRMGAWLTGWFGLLALSLTVFGTYGIVAYTLARRTPEVGLRIALGASPARMPLLMLRVGLLPVAAGTVLGAVAAWATARLIKTFLFGVPPFDPAAFASSTALMVAVAASASYLAARRASRVNPMETLRAE
jgi:predicted permease